MGRKTKIKDVGVKNKEVLLLCDATERALQILEDKIDAVFDVVQRLDGHAFFNTKNISTLEYFLLSILSNNGIICSENIGEINELKEQCKQFVNAQFLCKEIDGGRND